MPPTSPRRQLNVRLPPDIIEQVEADKRSKQAVVEDALRAWYSNGIADDSSENSSKQDVIEDALRACYSKTIADDSSENGSRQSDSSNGIADDSRNDSDILVTALTGQLHEKDKQISEKDQQIAELHVILQTSITPQPQLPAAEPERKWWQVWKV